MIRFDHGTNEVQEGNYALVLLHSYLVKYCKTNKPVTKCTLFIIDSLNIT